MGIAIAVDFSLVASPLPMVPTSIELNNQPKLGEVRTRKSGESSYGHAF